MRKLLAAMFIVNLVACGSGSRPTAPSAIPLPAAPRSGRIFEMTFTADAAACQNLPEQARSRTYTATLSADETVGTLTGANFPATDAYSHWNVVYTKFWGTSAEVFFSDPPIWEALSDESYIVIY